MEIYQPQDQTCLDLMIRSIAIPNADYILIETNAQHCATYVLAKFKLITHQGEYLEVHL